MKEYFTRQGMWHLQSETMLAGDFFIYKTILFKY